MGEQATAYPFQDDNKKGNGKCNGSVAGGGFTSHPSQSARWMGHPFLLGLFEKEQRQQHSRSHRDNKNSKDKGNGSVAGGGFASHPSHSARRMGHPFLLWLFEKGTRGKSGLPLGMTTRGLGLLLRQGSGWMVVLKRN